MVLARDLEQGGERLVVPVDKRADLLRDVLVDQQDSNIVALLGVVAERFLDIRGGRLAGQRRACGTVRTLLSTT